MILTIIYILGLFITYALLEIYEEHADDAGAMEHAALSMFWPVLLVICVVALPFLGITKLINILKEEEDE